MSTVSYMLTKILADYEDLREADKTTWPLESRSRIPLPSTK